MNIRADSAQLTLKSVVYATDLSPSSENAGRYASMLARKFDADLLVSHVFLLTQAALEAEAESTPTLKSQQRKDLEIAAAAAAARFGQGVKRTETVLLEGDPRDRIPQLAQERAPSIVVMGTSGRGRIERSLTGSLAERILRASSEPSLTVSPLVPALEPGYSGFRRVLFATSFSPESEHGARYAIGIAKAFQASMEVLHVVKADDVEPPEYFDSMMKQFRALAGELDPDHAESFFNPKGVVEVGSAHQQILEHVREFAADLLVLSIHRSSHLWLQARLSGAFHIIANATCPVLTITG